MNNSGVVLQVCPNDHPPFKQICAVYAQAAASIGVELHTVFLSPSQADDSLPSPAAGSCHYLDASSLQDTADVVRRLLALVATIAPSDGFDLCLCHRYRSYAVVQASKLTRRKTVAIAHEFGFFKRLRRRLGRRLFARQVFFAGVSVPVVEELRKEYPSALLLPNAIELSKVQSEMLERPAARLELGIADDAFTVGVVGRLHHKKQPELALAGFAEFAAQHPKAQLVFMGDGEKREQLEFSAAEQPLPVIFTGNVDRGYRYFRGFDLLLVTAGPEEAFGMVLLEAMAAGVLIVLGPAPGPQSVVDETAITFDAFDAQRVAVGLQKGFERSQGNAESHSARQTALLNTEYSVASVARRLDALLTG